MNILFSPSEGKDFMACLESAKGHSALSDKSAMCKCGFVASPLHGKARGVDEPCVLSPCSPHQSALFSSQILECLGESLPKDSKGISDSAALDSRTTSETTHSVIASVVKQSIKTDSKKIDYHADKPTRNDKKTESTPHATLKSPAQESIRAYLSFLHSASDAQIATLFGSKILNLDELALAQNLLSAPRIEAVRLYNGVAYKALDFASLDSEAQAYLREHLYIFSNLFAMVRADTPLPYYNLHQGKGRGALSLQNIYAAHRERIDEELRDCEVLDLRAEAYCKVYECKSARSLFKVEFLKNGKKVSHYAKHYRGIYARALAQSGITSLSQLQDLHIKDLSLTQVEQRQNATILVYEVLT